MKLFVEGGGDRDELRTQCRKAFAEFFRRAGIPARPRVVAGGGRRQTLDQFNSAIARGESAMVLVDSEGPVPAGESAKAFLDRTENRPFLPGVGEEAVHLMIQAMESWFLADPEACQQMFGSRFRRDRTPGGPLEAVARQRVFDWLGALGYDKSRHSFELVGLLNPALVQEGSPAAQRLIATLRG